MDNLDRDLLFKLSIRAFGKVNLAHAACTQSAQYPVRSDAVANHLGSMHPDTADLQTTAPLRAGACYVYESWAPQWGATRRSWTPCQTDTIPRSRHLLPLGRSQADPAVRNRETSTSRPRLAWQSLQGWGVR